MSKEYEEFFNSKINIEGAYDMQADDAAELGWNGARDTIVKILRDKTFSDRSEGDVILLSDIIKYIEKL